ncbi:MAG TPA: S41 family peptidase [Thermoanaerobaculia bacterium]
MIVLALLLVAATSRAEPCDVVPPLADALRQHYVFEDVGARMADTVVAHRDAYHRLSGAELAVAITSDLRSVTGDKHVLVRLAENTTSATPAGPARHFDAVQRVEILEGNIGYLDLRGFERRNAQSDAKIAAAFELLRGVDSLIIDLRANGGGNPDMVALVSSYVLDGPTLLAEMRHREAPAEQLSTPPRPAGALHAGTPLFLLTSHNTFSAGEGFAFILQHLGRARVIGERTAGAAHAGRAYPLACGFEAIIPNTAVVLPGTTTDWEGTGVVPDVEITADQAFAAALKAARMVGWTRSPQSDSRR